MAFRKNGLDHAFQLNVFYDNEFNCTCNRECFYKHKSKNQKSFKAAESSMRIVLELLLKFLLLRQNYRRIILDETWQKTNMSLSHQ